VLPELSFAGGLIWLAVCVHKADKARQRRRA
jgi:hypothetical protein